MLRTARFDQDLSGPWIQRLLSWRDRGRVSVGRLAHDEVFPDSYRLGARAFIVQYRCEVSVVRVEDSDTTYRVGVGTAAERGASLLLVVRDDCLRRLGD